MSKNLKKTIKDLADSFKNDTIGIATMHSEMAKVCKGLEREEKEIAYDYLKSLVF